MKDIDDARERLFARFAELGIAAPTIAYPAHVTVEEGKRLRGEMVGTFTKNLLLRDKKGRLFLIAVHEDRALDLKTLHSLLGANGRLGFAPAERMESVLGVGPGWLTPFSIINDRGNLVTVVLDAALLQVEQVNFHPLVQEESTGLAPEELVAFVRSCGREVVVVDLGAGPAPA
jgi:Ala-tRNA(Pro) deacylase